MSVADYLDRRRRSVAEIVALRILPRDRVVHETHGPGTVSIVMAAAESGPGRHAAAIAEALVHFDNGAHHLVALHHLTKIAGVA